MDSTDGGGETDNHTTESDTSDMEEPPIEHHDSSKMQQHNVSMEQLSPFIENYGINEPEIENQPEEGNETEETDETLEGTQIDMGKTTEKVDEPNLEEDIMEIYDRISSIHHKFISYV